MRPKGTRLGPAGAATRHLFLVLSLIFTVSFVTIFYHLNVSVESDSIKETLMESSGSHPRKVETSTSSTSRMDNVEENEVLMTTRVPITDSQDGSLGKSQSNANRDRASAIRRVHVFYYPWYGNPAIDEGGWNHWDHTILPHWNEGVRAKYVHNIKYSPPEDIGSVFYPLYGPYSSADPEIIDVHMEELRDYVVVVSWWGMKPFL